MSSIGETSALRLQPTSVQKKKSGPTSVTQQQEQQDLSPHIMSTKPTSKKRKSVDRTEMVVKKTKITKSADKARPLKSALKNPRAEVEGKTHKVTKATMHPKPDKDVSTTTKARKMKPEPLVEETPGTTDLTPDQTASLLAGFSSSDEEAGSGSDREVGIALSSIPKAPHSQAIQEGIRSATEAKKHAPGLKAAAADPETTPGTLYLGRLPHGFFEPQLRAYFSQFGEITHLRLARNRRTGKSQHHAFIEFASAAVADIVAKTMDKYLLFGHILQVKIIPRESIGEGLWVGEGRRKWAPRNRMEGRALKMGATREQWAKRVENEKQKRAQKKTQLEEMGYEFEMPDVKDVDTVPLTTDTPETEQQTTEVAEMAELAPAPMTEAQPPTEEKKRAASGKPKGSKKAIKKVKT